MWNMRLRSVIIAPFRAGTACDGLIQALDMIALWGIYVMENPFFDHPILNSPYEIPSRHWELDEETKQPTRNISNKRRSADFYTPIPKPKKQKDTRTKQRTLGFSDTEDLLSTGDQEYSATAIINQLRDCVDKWRQIPDPSGWDVTPETARILQHWRHHDFSRIRPFFCQVEAAETAIWLTEVAPNTREGKFFIEHIKNANNDANPGLKRLALKLATGAGKTTVMAMENIPGDVMPKFRDLWENIRSDMPKKGRGKSHALDPLSIPILLQNALQALYGHYEKTHKLWEDARIGVPHCFIIVCNNTSTSKLVYDYVSGFKRKLEDGSEQLELGRLKLFRNFDENGMASERPSTLLIDSEQLESGEGLDDAFRKNASDEIERFRRERVERQSGLRCPLSVRRSIKKIQAGFHHLNRRRARAGRFAAARYRDKGLQGRGHEVKKRYDGHVLGSRSERALDFRTMGCRGIHRCVRDRERV
ncbi:MAG: hypothetical protein LBQ58_06360 [Synergistaceae bacterium]|nr:hypothetical protein [Synergistaceae bacterium]